MSRNKIVEPKEEVKQEVPPKKDINKKQSSNNILVKILSEIVKTINKILRGEIFKIDKVIKTLPLILFIVALIVIYIWNSYWADKKVREIYKIKKELKELRFEYITNRSELMNNCKQSEIARRLDSTGIKESVVPPQKIFIKE